MWGAHYTIYFSLCVRISGGEKALKKWEDFISVRGNLIEYKASKTGQLVKTRCSSTEWPSSCPHLLKHGVWGRASTDHRSDFHLTELCSAGLLLGAWKLTGQGNLCWVHSLQGRLGQLSNRLEEMEISRTCPGRGKKEDPSLSLVSSLTLFPGKIPNKYQQNHAIWDSRMPSWQCAMASTLELWTPDIFQGHTQLFFSAPSSHVLLMHSKNYTKFGLRGGMVKSNNAILDTKMTYWDL